MARTISINDDDTGINATVVVEAPEDQSPPIIRSISLVASNGHGVRADDLRMLESLGLKLPTARTPFVPDAANSQTEDALPDGMLAVDGLPPEIAQDLAQAEFAQDNAYPAPQQRTQPRRPPANKGGTLAWLQANRTPPADQPQKATQKATPAKKAKPEKAAPAEKQPYRQAPPDYELLADFNRFRGSATAIAEAHGVPRYTAAGWINKARKRGIIPPSTRTSKEK